MSNEIVSVVDGNETLSVDTGKGANGLRCRPHGFELENGIRPWAKIDLIGGNHKLNQFLTPNQGHKHVSHSNPTPASVKPVLENMKEPSVLLLRGCELLLQTPFPFEKFKTLTSLEIASISYLTTVPDAISKMTQLQALNLSHLPIEQFPSDQFFSNLTNLRSLVLRGCCNLLSLPPFPRLPALQFLDLSGLLIETFPLTELSYIDTEELCWLILRGCSRLRSIPTLSYFQKLEVLDLSHCTTLQWIEGIDLFLHPSLQMLDLSYTSALPKIVLRECPKLTHLFLKDVKEIEIQLSVALPRLSILDLSGVKNVDGVHKLKSCLDLVDVDLSRIGIQSIDFLSDLIHLRRLVLRKCTKLANLPEMKRLTNLEVLDISGCEILTDLPEDLNYLKNIRELNLSGCSPLVELREGLFDDMSCLEKLDLSKTNINHLPSFASLINLRTLNLSHTPIETLPELSNLRNLKELILENCQKLEQVPNIQRLTNPDKLNLSLPGTDGVDLIGVQSSGSGNFHECILGWDGNIRPTHLGRIPNPDEFHLVSTFIGESGFDRFKYEFTKLDMLISNMAKKIKPTPPNKIIDPTTTNKMRQRSNPPPLTDLTMKFGSIHGDLRYILKNIDLLESSSNCRSSEEILHELVNVATSLSNDDFSLDSIDLSELIRVVAKLKLLVPPPKQVGGDENKKKKKKNILLTSNKDKEEVISGASSPDQNLLSSYDSLTDIQRNCLLYFAAFSSPVYARLSIKNRQLIHLWYGEGFIDPNPNLELGTSAYTGLVRNDARQLVSSTKGVENPRTIKEIGQQILKVLDMKGFIVVQNENICYMEASIHNFVKAQAKALHFFDFNEKNWNLTSHFKGSQRACLLKPQAHVSSSCQLWLSYANSSKKLESFEKIRTILHVSEPIIDLNVEWFSKMRNLIVLHLGSLNFDDEEHIDVMDLKFMGELKNMKQLRLLSLEGFSAIQKLPDSICKLINLRILNLRYCCNLEELPSSIGSLQSLTHLDLTYCHLLSKLPKGLALLTQLEVLKGFVINYEAGGQQHAKACTLKELLKLKNLRILNLVVNRDNFPCGKDLHVFREMNNLCNLQITWQKDFDKDREPKDAIGHEAPRPSRWKQLKCWKQQARQSDTEEPFKRNHLHNLKKLVMYCFPSETAPDWLHPSELQKLEKLYIIGGNLKTLPGGTDQCQWSVNTLRLKHLSIHINQPEASLLFVNLSSFLRTGTRE